MNKPFFLPRFLALGLSLSLSLPAPALAMRAENLKEAGSEEQLRLALSDSDPVNAVARVSAPRLAGALGLPAVSPVPLAAGAEQELKSQLEQNQYPGGPIQMIVDAFAKQKADVVVLADIEQWVETSPYDRFLRRLMEELAKQTGVRRVLIENRPEIVEREVVPVLGQIAQTKHEDFMSYRLASSMGTMDDLYLGLSVAGHLWPMLLRAHQLGFSLSGFDLRPHVNQFGQMIGDASLPMIGGATEEGMRDEVLRQFEANGRKPILVIAGGNHVPLTEGLNRFGRLLSQAEGLRVLTIGVDVGWVEAEERHLAESLYQTDLPMVAISDSRREPLGSLQYFMGGVLVNWKGELASDAPQEGIPIRAKDFSGGLIYFRSEEAILSYLRNLSAAGVEEKGMPAAGAEKSIMGRAVRRVKRAQEKAAVLIIPDVFGEDENGNMLQSLVPNLLDALESAQRILADRSIHYRERAEEAREPLGLASYVATELVKHLARAWQDEQVEIPPVGYEHKPTNEPKPWRYVGTPKREDYADSAGRLFDVASEVRELLLESRDLLEQLDSPAAGAEEMVMTVDEALHWFKKNMAKTEYKFYPIRFLVPDQEKGLIATGNGFDWFASNENWKIAEESIRAIGALSGQKVRILHGSSSDDNDAGTKRIFIYPAGPALWNRARLEGGDTRQIKLFDRAKNRFWEVPAEGVVLYNVSEAYGMGGVLIAGPGSSQEYLELFPVSGVRSGEIVIHQRIEKRSIRTIPQRLMAIHPMREITEGPLRSVSFAHSDLEQGGIDFSEAGIRFRLEAHPLGLGVVILPSGPDPVYISNNQKPLRAGAEEKGSAGFDADMDRIARVLSANLQQPAYLVLGPEVFEIYGREVTGFLDVLQSRVPALTPFLVLVGDQAPAYASHRGVLLATDNLAAAAGALKLYGPAQIQFVSTAEEEKALKAHLIGSSSSVVRVPLSDLQEMLRSILANLAGLEERTGAQEVEAFYGVKLNDLADQLKARFQTGV